MSRLVIKNLNITEDNLLISDTGNKILARKKFTINADKVKIQIGVLGSHFTLGLILQALRRCVYLDEPAVIDALLSIRYRVEGLPYGDDFYVVVVNDKILVQRREPEYASLYSCFSDKTLIGDYVRTGGPYGFGPSSDKFKGLQVYGVDTIKMFCLNDSEVKNFLNEEPDFVFVTDDPCDLSFLFRQRSHFCRSY